MSLDPTQLNSTLAALSALGAAASVTVAGSSVVSPSATQSTSAPAQPYVNRRSKAARVAAMRSGTSVALGALLPGASYSAATGCNVTAASQQEGAVATYAASATYTAVSPCPASLFAALLLAILIALTVAALTPSSQRHRVASSTVSSRWLGLVVMLCCCLSASATGTEGADDGGLPPESASILAGLVALHGVRQLIDTLVHLRQSAVARLAAPVTATASRQRRSTPPSPLSPLPSLQLLAQSPALQCWWLREATESLTNAWGVWLRETVRSAVIAAGADRLQTRRLRLTWATWRHDFVLHMMDCRKRTANLATVTAAALSGRLRRHAVSALVHWQAVSQSAARIASLATAMCARQSLQCAVRLWRGQTTTQLALTPIASPVCDLLTRRAFLAWHRASVAAVSSEYERASVFLAARLSFLWHWFIVRLNTCGVLIGQQPGTRGLLLPDALMPHSSGMCCLRRAARDALAEAVDSGSMTDGSEDLDQLDDEDVSAAADCLQMLAYPKGLGSAAAAVVLGAARVPDDVPISLELPPDLPVERALCHSPQRQPHVCVPPPSDALVQHVLRAQSPCSPLVSRFAVASTAGLSELAPHIHGRPNAQGRSPGAHGRSSSGVRDREGAVASTPRDTVAVASSAVSAARMPLTRSLPVPPGLGLGPRRPVVGPEHQPSPPPSPPEPRSRSPQPELSLGRTATPCSELGVTLAVLGGALSSAVAARDAASWDVCSGSQTPRTLRHQLTVDVRRVAWHLLAAVPRQLWYVLSVRLRFCHRLRRAAEHRIAARRAAAALRARVLELRSRAPSPLTGFDVGLTVDSQLLYRSPRGVVSTAHPACRPDELIPLGSALLADGSVSAPLQPPSGSYVEPVPDASGAICYVDRDTGEAQWSAPLLSSPMQPRSLLAAEHDFDAPPSYPTASEREPDAPSRAPYGLLTLATLRGTHWRHLPIDGSSRVTLYHEETGAVREGPWISLRWHNSLYYVNIITRETRWFPPHRWMEGWISRACDDGAGSLDTPFAGTRVSQWLWPLPLSRVRTEGGGVPTLYERGLPPWPIDAMDDACSHPLAIATPPNAVA